MVSESNTLLQGVLPSSNYAVSSLSTAWTASDLEAWRASMQEIHDSGTNLPLAWRRTQLQAMRRLIVENRPLLLDALKQDLKKHETEADTTELEQVLGEIQYLERNLKRLLQPKRVASPACHTPARSWMEFRPLLGPGVLVIGPFNYPLMLVLQPTVAALAAGNPTIIKPSENCPAVCDILALLIPRYFDSTVCRVVQGSVEESKLLLSYPWGKVFFTGSSTMGKLVAQQTAQTLTPTLLELGGKCPAYIDGETSNSIDWPLVASRIIWAKLLNCGQSCVAVDYLIVHKKDVEKLVPCLIQAVKQQFGPDPYHSEMGRVVKVQPHAERHVQMIRELEDICLLHATDDGIGSIKPCQIVLGSSAACRPKEKYICPTLVLNPPLDSRIMEEEVFGPILPILTVNDRSEAIALMKVVESRIGTPLCLYVFAKSDKVFSEVTQTCRSGSAMFNDCLVQFSNLLIPFGGLGTSGIGRYHGPFSFELFSQPFACMYRPLIPGTDYGGLRCHPYGSGLKQWVVRKVAIKLPYIPVIPDTFKSVVAIVVFVMVCKAVVPSIAMAHIVRSVCNFSANRLEQLVAYLRDDDDKKQNPRKRMHNWRQ